MVVQGLPVQSAYKVKIGLRGQLGGVVSWGIPRLSRSWGASEWKDLCCTELTIHELLQTPRYIQCMCDRQHIDPCAVSVGERTWSMCGLEWWAL